MTDESATPVDVMALDANSEIAARLHQCPVEVRTRGCRPKSTSPSSKRLAKKTTAVVHRLASKLMFEPIIPFEFSVVPQPQRDSHFTVLYDYGCKTYALLQRFAYGESSVAKNNDSAAKSTIAKIAKTLGFSSSTEEPPAVNFPPIEVLINTIAKKGLHDAQLLAGLRVAISAGALTGQYSIDEASPDPNKLSPELAATALIALTKMAMRCRPTRAIESAMAVHDDDEDDNQQDPDDQQDEADEDDDDEYESDAVEKPNGDGSSRANSPNDETYSVEDYGIRKFPPLDRNMIQQNGLLEIACHIGFPGVIDLLAEHNKIHFYGEFAETTPLMEAMAAGTVQVVKKLIALGEDVNCKSKNTSNTPLIYGAVAGHVDCMEALLETGKCSLTSNNCNGHDALMEAANAGRTDVVKLLLKNGADPRFLNLNTEFKESALTLAAYKGHFDIVEILLDVLNRRPLDDDEQRLEREEELHTALMECSMEGHVDVARLLLDNGAPLNLNSESFESPLTLACCGGHPDLVDLFIREGADIEEKNDENYTPLMEAAREGHIGVVKVLLAHGAKVNITADDNGDTPLSVAACGGNIEIMEEIMNYGGDVTAGMSPPIVEAAQEGLIDTVQFIISKCQKIPQDQLNHALLLSAESGHRDVVLEVIKAGADANTEIDGRTPLMKAAKSGHIEIVEELIKAGAVVNKQSCHIDATACSLACGEGNTDIVQLLLKHGADPYIECKEGTTCFYEASKNGNVHLVNMLIEYSKSGCITKHMDSQNKSMIPKTKANMKYFKKSIQKKVGGALTNHMSMTEMMMLFQNGTAKKKGALAKLAAGNFSDLPVSTHEVDMLQHLLKLQQQMAAFDSHKMGSDVPEEKNKEVANALKALKAVYGTTTDEKINFPAPPTRTDMDRLYCGEMVPSIKQWAELVAHGWLEMERYVGHPIDLGSFAHCNEGHSTNAAAAVSAAAAAATGIDSQTYLASVFAKMNNGEDMPRVPATVGSLNAASAAMSGISFHSEDAMRLFSHQLQSLKDPKRSCHAHGPTAESAFRAALLKMGTSFKERRTNPSFFQDSKRNFPAPESLPSNRSILESGIKVTPMENPIVTTIPSCLTAPKPAEVTHPTKQPPNSPAAVPIATKKPSTGGLSSVSSKAYPGIIRLAIEMDKKYQADPSEENKEMAILTAYIASTLPKTEYNGQDIETGDRLLKKHLSGMKTSEINQTMKRVKILVNSESGNKRLREEYIKLFRDQSEGSFYEECIKDKKVQDAAKSQEKLRATANAASNTNAAKAQPKSSTSSLRRTHSEGDGTDRTSKSRSSAIDKATDTSLETPLSIACANGHKEVVELLIKEGANIEHRDKKGFTPLIVAATAGHFTVCEVLLKNHAAIEAQSDRTKDTALSLACSGGRKEVVELLLQNNANKEHRNVSDYTPLSLAASGGYIDIVNMLLDAGAEINSRTGSKLGISPLMLSAMNGHREATRVLLEKGSDINAQIETNRNTALTLACFQGRTDVVKLLVNSNANVEHRAKTGLTPLMEAANGGYTDVGDLLLKAGGDPNAAPVPSSRDSALTIAADKGHDKFVELLLNHGAFIDVKNKKGCTALWLACNGGHFETAQCLMNYNADPDAFDNRKISPMVAAFKKGHVELVNFMVKYAKQFPSDQDLERTICSTESDDIRDKCNECMNVIRGAKSTQAESANKAAESLLALLEEEEKNAKTKKAKKQAKKQEKKAAKKKDEKKEEEVREPTPVPVEEPVPEPEPVVIVEEPEKKVEVVETQKPVESKKKNKKNKNEKNVEKARQITPVVEATPPPPPIVVHIPPKPIVVRIPGPSLIHQETPLSPRADEWMKATGKKQKAAKKPSAVSGSNSGNVKESSTTSSVTSEFAHVQEIDTNRQKQWGLTVGSATIARIIGRGGNNINAVREATGASIEIEKQGARKDPAAERQITVRGPPDAVKTAVQIIQHLINDVDIQISDAIRMVLRGNSSVASSISSEGTNSRAAYEPAAPPPLTIAKSISLINPSSAQKSASAASSNSNSSSTGNVWQQRMAARQEQIAKTAHHEETVAVQPPPPQNMKTAPVAKVQPVEKTKVSVATKEPSHAIAPPVRREPVSATIQPLQSFDMPNHAEPQRSALPDPIGRPIQSIHRVLEEPSALSGADFAKAPGSRPSLSNHSNNAEPYLAFARAPAPPVASTSFNEIQQQVAFGQYLPPTQPNKSPKNPMFFEQTPEQSQQQNSIIEALAKKQPEAFALGEDLGLDMSKLSLFNGDTLAEIWGKPEKEQPEQPWASQLFTPFSSSNLGNSSGLEESMNEWPSELLSSLQAPTNTSNLNRSANQAQPQQQQIQQPSNLLTNRQESVPAYSSTRDRDFTKSVPLFARTTSQTVSNQSAAQQQQQQQQQISAILQQSHLANMMQNSQQNQRYPEKPANNMYSQLAAQLLTHQEASSSTVGGQQQPNNSANYYPSPSYTDSSTILSSLNQIPMQPRLKTFNGFSNEPQATQEDLILSALLGDKQLGSQGNAGMQQQNYMSQNKVSSQSAYGNPLSQQQQQQQQQRNMMASRQNSSYGAPPPPPGFAALTPQNSRANVAQSQFYPMNAPQQVQQQQQQQIFNQFNGQNWGSQINAQQQSQSSSTNKPTSSLWGNATWN